MKRVLWSLVAAVAVLAVFSFFSGQQPTSVLAQSLNSGDYVAGFAGHDAILPTINGPNIDTFKIASSDSTYQSPSTNAFAYSDTAVGVPVLNEKVVAVSNFGVVDTTVDSPKVTNVPNSVWTANNDAVVNLNASRDLLLPTSDSIQAPDANAATDGIRTTNPAAASTQGGNSDIGPTDVLLFYGDSNPALVPINDAGEAHLINERSSVIIWPLIAAAFLSGATGLALVKTKVGAI